MKKRMLCVLLLILLILTACGPKQPQYSESVKEIPDYSNEAYFVLNNNVPEFSDSDIVSTAYEYYSELDALGRCGYAMACVGPETMPAEERGAIGQVKPSGWQTVKYDFVDGKYEWYVNGVMDSTANGAFYYLPDGETFSEDDCFYMIAVRGSDGIRMQTCEFCPGIYTSVDDIYDSNGMYP